MLQWQEQSQETKTYIVFERFLVRVLQFQKPFWRALYKNNIQDDKKYESELWHGYHVHKGMLNLRKMDKYKHAQF